MQSSDYNVNISIFKLKPVYTGSDVFFYRDHVVRLTNSEPHDGSG